MQIPFSRSGGGLLVMKESPLVRGKVLVNYHPQPAGGIWVQTGLKGEVVLCFLCETNSVFDRARV